MPAAESAWRPLRQSASAGQRGRSAHVDAPVALRAEAAPHDEVAGEPVGHALKAGKGAPRARRLLSVPLRGFALGRWRGQGLISYSFKGLYSLFISFLFIWAALARA